MVRALAKRGYRIRVAVRRPDLAGHLQPLGRVGQIHAVQANLRYPASVEAAARDADVVINLVGILFERGRQRFDAVQAFGAEAVALAAAAIGARMVHVSAIGADEQRALALCALQGAGREARARGRAVGRHPAAVDPVRPGGRLLQPVRRAWRASSPALPLIGGGHTRFQPVFVGDVASAIVAAVEGRAAAGTIYELGGPEVKSFKELMEYVLATIERRRLLVPIPFGLARFQASFLQFMPKPLLTPDQVELLRGDNVVSEEAKREGRTLEALGIEPVAMEAIVPSYLWRFRKTGQFRTAAATPRDGQSPCHPKPVIRSLSSPARARSGRASRRSTRHQANSAKPWRVT